MKLYDTDNLGFIFYDRKFSSLGLTGAFSDKSYINGITHKNKNMLFQDITFGIEFIDCNAVLLVMLFLDKNVVL